MPRRPKGEGGEFPVADIREAKHRMLEAYSEELHARVKHAEQEFNDWIRDISGQYLAMSQEITIAARAFHDLNQDEIEYAATEKYYPVSIEITICKQRAAARGMTKQVFVRVDKRQFFWNFTEEEVVGELNEELADIRERLGIPVPIVSKRIEKQGEEVDETRDDLVRQLQNKGYENINPDITSAIDDKTREYYQNPPKPPVLLEDASQYSAIYYDELDKPLRNNPDASYVSFNYDSLFGNRATQEFDSVPFSGTVNMGNDPDMNRKLWAYSCARAEVMHETLVHK
ncbi:hypothetical protein A3B21_03100 [Candidatus Uhrbacteria bacterium RIFCSPLOWO2_01_FULL_47_24]|uniref:Uncharacterized protein n=1 Tax=Candidatus Uhrbacteria bacterium RIFCSPLOWO2_01_FULL_47_24 TaxID=1802401 RepID=A0A1F7UT83_9BACT|nr:MAG: hypothetical protein A2753_05025 [Candidatus Uhrbacteria bacterium RIFCSPHIGHO2_01_FULL_47_11]OGL67574.1 MAG: hypothetical protein A3D58_03700 [Candidatus Uhrbacteria bacterium RIFCSPHIGHO2_02_FULL_46_47]OGL75171.1 MAG: hypothetical protein A3F52_02715 [Candidatus Uhrbacteria bacterium RIFCSPHIGHO2_12_FULL_47_11]OGL80928.1 MAG: hypothetical protein A3B21_03100 [Candidatus Uhrbacteria bacterium RIFCSPLOWO2_01_FULL_47_24]OGL84263.1 MAG: hypothetical protein A3J03_03100 [Candidatus Uhrbact